MALLGISFSRYHVLLLFSMLLAAMFHYQILLADLSTMMKDSTSSPTTYEGNVTKEIHKFEILCTAPEPIMSWGSFRIRCRDFKSIAEHCANVVRVSIHSHEEILRAKNTSLSKEQQPSAMKNFNATISLKKGLKPLPRFGRIFVDVVDHYQLKSKNLKLGNEVLVQSKYHGMDVFEDRKYYVVEHWYNSFPQDMLMGSHNPQFTIPTIQDVSTLQVATIWNNKRTQCPQFSSNHSGSIVYSCINKPFRVETWYTEFFKSANSSELERLDKLLQDPSQGSGRIFYELFWEFDALIVPAKSGSRKKLRYGNIQRTVSQMRSGVPVLLEINGEVLQDFLITHNYTCAFVMENALLPLNMTRRIWSLDEAIDAMKSTEIRQKCQDEGLEIAKYYFSPGVIVQKELHFLGYVGEFDCNRLQDGDKWK